MKDSELLQTYAMYHSELVNERKQYETTWRDIRDFLAPRTARFDGEKINDGVRQDLNIINTAPRMAVRTLPAGMQSGVTSPMRPWFRLGLPDPELQNFQPVKEWLFDTERRMMTILARSNIYDKLKSCYGTLGIYGTGSFFIDEDDEDLIRAHTFPIGSFSISTDAAGRTDILFRNVSMNARQIVRKFPDRVPSEVKTAYDAGNYGTTYEVCHYVMPNPIYRASSMLSKYKKFMSVWVFKPAGNDKRAILSMKGYNESPMMCPRWDVLGEDTWGVGCGEEALGDAKQLQKLERRKLQGVDKNVNPTMVADASMRQQRLSNMPGDTVFVNGLVQGRGGYGPAYQPNPYLRELKEEISGITARIDEAFYKNLFLMVTDFASQPNITATQINTLKEEKLMMLGPVLERLNDELLDPMMDRQFNIMNRAGLIAPAPEEIQGMPLRIEYVSVLAQAQKAMGIANVERFVGFVGNLAAAGRPDAWDKLNVDEIIDEYADGTAVPPRIVKPTEQADEGRAARAQQEQAAQAMQMGMAGADVANKLAGTNMTGDNALTRMMGAQ